MPIPTLNDPISGEELKEILIQRIRATLDRDVTLTNDITYAGFEFRFTADIRFKRSATRDTLAWGETKAGDLDDSDPDNPVISNPVTAEYETDSPNSARTEHNLPIPTMVNSLEGPRRERVHIPENQRKGPGRPRNPVQ